MKLARVPEEWRDIAGYEGYYQVSSLGRVRSLRRKVRHGFDGRLREVPSRILKVCESGKYPRVGLALDGRGRTHAVHRLVAETFLGPAPKGAEVLHANDVGTDNRVENLRWGTRSENLRDAVSNGGHYWANKTHCPNGHPYSGENLMVWSDGRRRCRTCNQVRGRQYWARKREAA